MEEGEKKEGREELGRDKGDRGLQRGDKMTEEHEGAREREGEKREER